MSIPFALTISTAVVLGLQLHSILAVAALRDEIEKLKKGPASRPTVLTEIDRPISEITAGAPRARMLHRES